MIDQWQVEWVDINSISLDPNNTNTHPPEQIDRLTKLMKHYGWVGNPVVATHERVCKAGEGRILSARKAGLKQIPVHFKQFANEDDEKAWATSDNAISQWAILDFSKINAMLPDLGPDFDLDMLGIKGFELDLANFEPGTEEDQGKLDRTQIIECPHCKEHFERGQAKVIA